MSEALAIHAGPADTNGKRLVIAQIGERSHRDHFDCNSQFQRQKFREALITKFDLGDDAHEFVEERVIAAADAEDERTTKGLSAAIVKLADVEAEQISWLWPNRIALGKLNLLAGDPGLGKSFLLLDLAARISLGSRWPDCDEHAPTGGVVLLTAEDGLADTVRPRLDAAGADVTKIIALSGVNGADGLGQYQRQIDLHAICRSSNKRLIKCRIVLCSALIRSPHTAARPILIRMPRCGACWRRLPKWRHVRESQLSALRTCESPTVRPFIELWAVWRSPRPVAAFGAWSAIRATRAAGDGYSWQLRITSAAINPA
jgi:hypothetical protein